MCVALLEGKPVVNLPGPPVAVFYGMDWCIRGIVYHLLNRPRPVRPKVEAVLTAPIRFAPHMEILCKMDLHKKDGGYETAQVPFKNSTTVESLCSDGLYITERGRDGYEAGERIEVELLTGEEFLTEE